MSSLESQPKPETVTGSQNAPQVPVAAFLTSALLWLSFAPVGIWPLAWLAPIPLLYLVAIPKISGKGAYCWVWLSGLAYWLATFYFVPIPHVALWAGWIVISSYLAFYTLFFFLSARTLVHKWKIPLIVAAPVCWTGIEFLRCNALTGMGLVCLSHSQFKQPLIIQCADLFGAYTLTFGMIAVAASLVATPFLLQKFPRPTNLLYGFLGLAVFSSILAYGFFAWQQTNQLSNNIERTPVQPDDSNEPNRSINIAIIQGSIDTRLNAKEEVQQEKFQQYTELTHRALEEDPSIDVVLWPENGLPAEAMDFVATTDSEEASRTEAAVVDNLKFTWSIASGYPRIFEKPTPMIVGGLTWKEPRQVYNSALYLDREGKVVQRYFKNHRVMYGEYFPILNLIPGLKDQLPEIDAGTEAASFEVQGIRLAPLICFETTVPHLVRRQLNRLRNKDAEPDAIINLTNDGWFFGTACLDFHLACNVFRAVEMRKRNIVCANTGFSADIHPSGRLEQVGPRRDTGILTARVNNARLSSLYRTIGDWPVMALTLLTLIGLIQAIWPRGRQTTAPPADQGPTEADNGTTL